jgi:N utilization substance protein B
MGRRTKARECALQMLYQWDLTREPMPRVAKAFWNVRSTTDETRARAEALAAGAQADLARIDEAIAAASAHWRFERLAAVDRNILRLGTYELLNERETPSAVIIDEAVEMAKRFGEADTAPFVNGVLDAIRARVREDEAAGPRRGRPGAKAERR